MSAKISNKFYFPQATPCLRLQSSFFSKGCSWWMKAVRKGLLPYLKKRSYRWPDATEKTLIVSSWGTFSLESLPTMLRKNKENCFCEVSNHNNNSTIQRNIWGSGVWKLCIFQRFWEWLKNARFRRDLIPARGNIKVWILQFLQTNVWRRHTLSARHTVLC